MKKRCEWAKDEPNITYHDTEWGKPEHDDTKLFEFLILEGAQAGLSWTTILKRRERYRVAFSGFDPKIVSQYDKNKIDALLKNPSIIQNKLKIHSAINNARQFLKIQSEFGSFDNFIWKYVDYSTIKNHAKNMSDIHPSSEISKKMSKDLKQYGFSFVGPTICYALMQAIGMVNDHVSDCFLYEK